MKVLLFLTSFRQVEEYGYFNRFLRRLPTLRDHCDIFIYCNNPDVSADLVTHFRSFPQANKRLYVTSLNAGHTMGAVEAVSQGIDLGLFAGYDFVIHLHPDVFIIEEAPIVALLTAHLDDDCVFFVNRSLPDDPRFFSFDFFIFKPGLLPTNIFKARLYQYTDIPEHYLSDVLVAHDVKFQIVKRFANDSWRPRRVDEHLGLYHEHDLRRVTALLHKLEAADERSARAPVALPPFPSVSRRPPP